MERAGASSQPISNRKPQAASRKPAVHADSVLMESFALAATHAGGITHTHIFDFSPAAVDVAKELRKATVVLVVGWITVTLVKELRAVYSRAS